MGRIICSKHGQQGIALVCDHVCHAVKCGNSGLFEPATVTLDFGKPVPNFSGLPHFVCASCATSVMQKFGAMRLDLEEDGEKFDQMIPTKPVCGRCYTEAFPKPSVAQ